MIYFTIDLLEFIMKPGADCFFYTFVRKNNTYVGDQVNTSIDLIVPLPPEDVSPVSRVYKLWSLMM